MTIIRIKRSSVSGNPNKLAAGELAYSALPDNGSNGGDRLYIGIGAETAGNAANHFVIGGKAFTDKLDHTPGILTTSSAVVVDTDGKVDIFNVDNLRLDGNTLSSTDLNGNIIINPNGSGLVSIANAYTLPRVDGLNGYVLTTNGSGSVTWQPSAATLNIAGDGATTSSISLLTQTLTIEGGINVDTTASAQKITISVDTATNSVVGVAKFNSANFDVTNGDVTIKDGSITNTQLSTSTITINSITVPLGGSATIGSALNQGITFGTGLASTNISGGFFNGNTATTISVDETIATTSTIQTFTNKTIDAAANTITNLTNANLSGSAGITNANLQFSDITIGSNSVSLGGTIITFNGVSIDANANTLTNITNANLSGSAGITNANLQYSAITFGNDSVSLGGTTTTFHGMSIDANNNTLTNITNANLSGNAGITNGNLQYSSITIGSDSISLGGTTATLHGVSIDANNNTLTNITNSNLSGNAGITNANLQYSSITLGSDIISLGGTTSTLAGLTISALNNTISNLSNSNLNGNAGITNANLQYSSITLGSTAVALGGTTSTIADLTQIEVGNITVQLGEISSTGNLNLSAGSTGTIIVNGVRISGLSTPTESTDAATKSYVDGVAQGLDVKDSVVVATTASITRSGTQTIDGIAVTVGQRVLVKAQANPEENGIYIVESSTWSRASDANTWTEMISAFTFVEQGNTYGDTGWVCTADAGGTIDVDPLLWSQFSGAGTYLAGTGLSLAGNTFSISTTYVGQSSITTLGTITAGVWNGSTIPVAHGGTGFTSYNAYDILIGNNSGGLSKLAIGLPGEILQVNTAGNALVYADLDGGEY